MDSLDIGSTHHIPASAKFVTALNTAIPETVYSVFDTAKANSLFIDQGVFSSWIQRDSENCTSFSSDGSCAPLAASAAVDTAVNANKDIRNVSEIEVLF